MAPDRVEMYCDGNLVKLVAQVNVGPTADKPYDQWVDGAYEWFIGSGSIRSGIGAVSEEVARALIRGWPQEPGGPCLSYGGTMTSGRVRLCGKDRWHTDSHAYEFGLDDQVA